jgi:hypothetical protein
MVGKQDSSFRLVITAIIVFVASGALTFFSIGWRNDLVIGWWSGLAIGWPIAASTAYLAMPVARCLTQRIVAAIERFSPAGADTPASCGRPRHQRSTSHEKIRICRLERRPA